MTPPTRHRSGDRVVTSLADRRQSVLEVIASARRRIILSLFYCTDEAVFEELARAVRRGVVVEALVTSRSKGKKKLRRLWDRLEGVGASIRPYLDPVVKYHAKYLVADDGPAVISSLNFTRKCFEKTVDALVITHDRAVVTSLRRLMLADCGGHRLPHDLSPRLIVGPERARDQITTIIQQARSSIRLLDPKLSDPALSALLETRRAGGLTVELHTAKRFGGLRAHGKIMLVDDSLAIVGSIALAALSLDFRREVAIIVEEPEAVASIACLFATLASAASAGTLSPTLVPEGTQC
jgi:phosphatidylserine/phosphatidylglycerophosphate/cardiolipin synthase-like enzyme